MEFPFFFDRYFNVVGGTPLSGAFLDRGEHNPYLVSISIILVIFTTYAAVAAAGRSGDADTPLARTVWLGLGASCMGLGIWAMHFVGMLGFSLPYSIAYEPFLTAFAVVPAIAASFATLEVLRGQRLLIPLWAELLGGVLMMTGIGAMHFIAMAAMRAEAVLLYDPARLLLIAVGVVILSAASLSLPRLLHHLFERPGFRLPWLGMVDKAVAIRAISATGLGCALACMHYASMWATMFKPEPGLALGGAYWESGPLAIWSTILVALGSTAVMAVVFAVKQRALAARMKAEVELRKRVETAVEEQRLRLQAIIDSAVDGIITVNAKGIIQHWSPGAQNLFGYTDEEVTGQNVDMLMPEPYRSNHDGYIARHQAGGDPRIIGIGREVTGLRKDGSTFPMDLSIGYAEVSGRTFYVGVVRDLTERKKTEAALEEARDKAEAAVRAKSEFLANMSHEIRTPMNGVLGFLTLAREREDLDEEMQMFMDTAYTSANSLLAVIDDILDFSKLESGGMRIEKVSFDLRDVVGEVADNLSLMARDKGLAFDWHADDAVPDAVLGDPHRIRQILFNLLGNAIKFTEKGGVHVSVSAARDSDMITLSVADTGIGMTVEVLERVMKPFEQADASTQRVYGGTGLGTTISSRLAAAMGGKLWAESTPGQGSTFFVQLPLPASSETAVDRPDDIPVRADRLDGRKLKILVAEDIEENTLLLKEMLQSRGHAVTVVGNGEEAVACAALQRFDAVLMDFQMPVLDGAEAAKRIREAEAGTGRAVPIIATTASASEEVRQKCLDAGMDDVVAKPINFAVLLNALVGAIERVEAAGGGGNSSAPETGEDILARQEFAWIVPIMEVDPTANDWPVPSRYQSFLHSLMVRGPQAMADLTAMIDRGENGDAETVVRAFYRAAVNMGLGDIADRARRVESLIEIAGSDGDGTKTLTDRRLALEDLRKSIVGLETLFAPEELSPSVAKEDMRPRDPELVRRLFGELQTALDTDNPDPSESALEKLSEHLDQEALAPVKDSVDAFNFSKARRQVSVIQSQLGLG